MATSRSSIRIFDKDFIVQIERKPNKNIYLRLISAQVLYVTCPYETTDSYIEKFIKDKAKWIYVKSLALSNSRKDFKDPIYYVGKAYHLKIEDGYSKIKITDDTIIIHVKDADFEKARRYFYTKAAKVLDELVTGFKDKYLEILRSYGYQNEIKLKYHLVKTRWGTCYTGRDLIELNELLIHFEPICLESVFWHECVHLLVPNHSKRFYQILEYHMPRYKEIQKLLK